MRYAIYEERQGFAPWVYAIVVGGLPIIVVVQAFATPPGPLVPWLLGGGMLLLTAFMLNLLSLRIRVEEQCIHVSLGWLFPLFWRRLPLADIEEVRPITYRPLRDAGGWGLRFGRFEGQRAQFWNARGSQGVYLQTPKSHFILGSQRPEALAEAIRQAMAARR